MTEHQRRRLRALRLLDEMVLRDLVLATLHRAAMTVERRADDERNPLGSPA